MEWQHVLTTDRVIDHWLHSNYSRPSLRPHIECWRCGADTGVVNSPLLAIPMDGIYCDECKKLILNGKDVR